jgi:desulfoferrodoxin (superoxide reductase-like protein)
MQEVISVKNQYGENIRIKLSVIESDGVKTKVILIHHEDCTEDFISWDELMLDYIINQEEFSLILNAAFELNTKYGNTETPSVEGS